MRRLEPDIIVVVGMVIIAMGLILAAVISGAEPVEEAMNKHAAAVARCKSIEGAEWGGGACYYNGIKLNFNEDYDGSEE